MNSPITRVAAAAATLCIAALTGSTDAAAAADTTARPAGRVVFDQWCASCHAGSESRAPSLESLQRLNHATIRYALTLGYMQQQAAGIAQADLDELIDYLAAGDTSDDWIKAAMCTAGRQRVDVSGPPTVASFGIDVRNQRRLTATQAGLTTARMRDLELAWAIAFPNTPTMRSQPLIRGNTIYIAATDSARLYALDAQTGCVKWVYKSETPLRSSLAFAGSPDAIVLGDAAGLVHSVDAVTGKRLWLSDVKQDSRDRVTGSPVVHASRVYVPLSSIEVNFAPNDAYECCKSHGSVVALELATGKKIWVAHTMEPATARGKSRAGTQQWGPSGAPIWSTPAIDAKRGLLYVGTGSNFSLPATATSDAILAIDLRDGSLRWSFQAVANDVWNIACGRGGANCDFGDKSKPVDLDFGASMILAEVPGKTDLLLAGHKSGTVWALDPDRKGAVVWKQQFGPGSPSGGIHWGMTHDGSRVFAPLNDPIGPGNEKLHGPGMQALDIHTGKVLWSYDAVVDCNGDRRKRAPNCDRRNGLSAAPLLVDGAVVTGSTDGMLRVFDAVKGTILFSYDTARTYDTVNGIPGLGGGIDSAPFAAAAGTLYVQSGYSRFGHPPGNVLLAFRPKGQ